MSQSIAKAIKYIKTPEELLKVLKRGSYTNDLINNNHYFEGAKTVNYQTISFGTATLEKYNLSTGYAQNEITADWKTLVLSQDVGHKIMIDKFEDEEAMANGIVLFVNRYILDVQAKALDIYRFRIITDAAGTISDAATLTASTVLGAVLDAFAAVENYDTYTEGNMLFYVSPQIDALLTEAAIGRGFLTIGSWGGDLDAKVELFKGAKKIVVPTPRLGVGVNFILLNKDAAPAFVKYQETVYFDQIPGHGNRKAEADIGIYHDCFVYEEAKTAIYVHKIPTHTLAFNKNEGSATGTMASITLNEGQKVVLPENAFVYTGYHFDRWDTASAGNGTPYAAKATFTMGKSDVTLYVVWGADGG